MALNIYLTKTSYRLTLNDLYGSWLHEIQQIIFVFSYLFFYTLFYWKRKILILLACSYLISIRSHCYNNTVVHYQVELIGSKGITTNTITVGNTEDCLCLSKTLCGSFWFHTLVVEQDIGEIQTAIITVSVNYFSELLNDKIL